MENGMKWNTKKSVIVRFKETREYNFFLSWIRMRMRREVKNLGVTITDDGISDSKLVDRIKKSKIVLGVLGRLGVFTNGVHLTRSIHVYKSLVQSRWECCLHLKPWKSRVELMFFGQISGRIAKRNLHRCRSMICILHPKARRDISAQMFVKKTF